MINFDKLADTAREGFNAQREAGYKTGRYVHNHHSDYDRLLSDKVGAEEAATEATRAFWGEFYDHASEIGDKLRELRELALEWQLATNTVTEEMPAGRTLGMAADSLLAILDREDDDR